MQSVERIALHIFFFHFNQYNRCKTYTRCEKGSGVDQFYKKEYIRLQKKITTIGKGSGRG